MTTPYCALNIPLSPVLSEYTQCTFIPGHAPNLKTEQNNFGRDTDDLAMMSNHHSSYFGPCTWLWPFCNRTTSPVTRLSVVDSEHRGTVVNPISLWIPSLKDRDFLTLSCDKSSNFNLTVKCFTNLQWQNITEQFSVFTYWTFMCNSIAEFMLTHHKF